MSSKIEKLQKYDSRGVQTLFRTLSRNHYNLLKMLDNKASIILTVNSIIISLMMGIIFVASGTEAEVVRVGSKILLNFGMLSMVFALMAMLPHRYRSKGKSADTMHGLLYAGMYSKLSAEEYESRMQDIITKGETVYHSLIKDMYQLGKSIAIKQRLIWVSVGFFLIGLALTIVHTLSHGVRIEDILIR